ncbi:MAG TPA: FecR domain-containing protein [Puia sp.]|nr:FecR domain-containing protein [Puia sp.]
MRRSIILSCVFFAACHGTNNPILRPGSSFANNSGSPKWVSLPDSSRIKISDGTTIVVGAGYSRGNRAVDLDGEGMFMIRGGDRFVVTTKNLYIQGMGTKFRVDAPRNKPGEEVDLLDGVMVIRKMYHSDLDSAQEVLHAGDMLMINREIDLMEKEKMDTDELHKAEAKF